MFGDMEGFRAMEAFEGQEFPGIGGFEFGFRVQWLHVLPLYVGPEYQRIMNFDSPRGHQFEFKALEGQQQTPLYLALLDDGQATSE